MDSSDESNRINRRKGESMSRQQAFEAIYAKQHDVPAESLVQYRHKSKEGYNLPGITSHYRTYCETLDSIVIELPSNLGFLDGLNRDFNEALNLCKASLTAAGVKYK